MVGLPILGGAILRVVLGIMTDRLGARLTALIGLVTTLLPLLLGWLWADSYAHMLVVGLKLALWSSREFLRPRSAVKGTGTAISCHPVT